MQFQSIIAFCGIAISLTFLPACGPEVKSKPNSTTAEPRPPLVQASGENVLALSPNPFLKNHGKDLVQWQPWGDAAFAEAAKRNVPVMLMVGYSSCPWTARMQKDSHMDPAVAGMINGWFVPVLVDREEQVDINQSMQRYAMLVGRRTGWPQHIWLTPGGKPLFSSGYIPHISKGNEPGMATTLEHVHGDWRKDPTYFTNQAEFSATQFLSQVDKINKGDQKSMLGTGTLDMAFEKLRSLFDPTDGGFTYSPKFPNVGSAEFMLTYARAIKATKPTRVPEAMGMLEATMNAILDRALQDQLSGGFHRYALDRAWTMPQHEKMLYDQGLMTSLLCELFKITGKPQYKQAVQNTLSYVLADLSHPSGAFYTSEHGSAALTIGGTDLVEGAYYLWDFDEVQKIVPADAWPLVKAVFDLSPNGNFPVEVKPISLERFPNKNVLRTVYPLSEAATRLNIPIDQATRMFEESKAKLLTARKNRPRPPRDEKLLPAWNGVMISGFANAGATFAEPAWGQKAVQALEFTLSNFLSPKFARPQYLQDYVTLIQAALDVYEATGQEKWIAAAKDLQERQDKNLWDAVDNGYWDGPLDKNLFFRTKSVDETTEFACNAVASSNLTRLWRLTGEGGFENRAKVTLGAFVGLAAATTFEFPAAMAKGQKIPMAITPLGPSMHVRLLTAYQRYYADTVHLFISGPPDSPVAKAVLQGYHPGAIVVYVNDSNFSKELVDKTRLLKENLPTDGSPAVLFAKTFQFQRKLTSPEQVNQVLKELY